MSPAERETCILDALGILPAVARRTGVASIRQAVADTEDYLQVGAAAIVEAADRYDPLRGAAFATYAWKAAHDAMYDEARRLRWRHQARLRPDRVVRSLDAVLGVHDKDETLKDYLHDPDPLPGAALESDETLEELHVAVDRLPPPQREAVRLHYLQGLDQPEIARRLGITQPAVSRRLHYARKNLRNILAAKEVA